MLAIAARAGQPFICISVANASSPKGAVSANSVPPAPALVRDQVGGIYEEVRVALARFLGDPLQILVRPIDDGPKRFVVHADSRLDLGLRGHMLGYGEREARGSRVAGVGGGGQHRERRGAGESAEGGAARGVAVLRHRRSLGRGQTLLNASIATLS
jgi:hypothetical protein